MRWSLRLGRIQSVPVEIHWSFFLLILWVAWQEWNVSASWTIPHFIFSDLMTDPRLFKYVAQAVAEGLRGVGFAVGLVVLAFASIVVHEVGHMVHAQALGIPVRRILLLPIGGLAELSRMPERGIDELRVAIAGPAANLGLGLIFSALAYAWLGAGNLSLSRILHIVTTGGAGWPFGVFFYLALTNFGLMLFNLIPAFPMDGGRVLRSLLTLVFQRVVATRIIVGLSWLFGAAFVALGLGFGEPWHFPPSLSLALIGLFVFFGAGFERTMDESRQILQKIATRAAVRQPTWTLAPTDDVTPQLVSAFWMHSALPVVVGPRVIGLLAKRDVEAALKRVGHSTVAHLMRTRFPYVRADEDLWRAQQVLLGAGLGALPVLDGEKLFGMLTPADIRSARALPPQHSETPTFISGGNSTV